MIDLQDEFNSADAYEIAVETRERLKQLRTHLQTTTPQKELVNRIATVHKNLNQLQDIAAEMGGYEDINGYGADILNATNRAYTALHGITCLTVQTGGEGHE